jgi:hypothetical protein
MSRSPLAALAAAVLAAVLPAAAQPTPAGAEFAISADTVSVNPSPTVAGNERGQSVVLWLGDCGGVGVCARAYDADGSPHTAETLLDLPPDVFSRAPAAALSSAGRLTVVWPGFDFVTQATNIYARAFSFGLAPQGASVVVANGGFSGPLDRPAIAPVYGGGAVVVWEELGLDLIPVALKGRRLGSDGQPSGAAFRVDPDDWPALATHASVAADGAGDFVVAWESIPNTADLDNVAARVFDPAGLPLGDAFVVHQQSSGIQESPAAAATPAGDFLVAWVSEAALGAGPGVYVRKVAAGGPLGISETKASSGTSGEDTDPAAAGGAAGFVVAWQTAAAASSSVSARAYNLAGVPLAGAQVLESSAGVHDSLPAVAVSGAGDLFAAWTRRNADFHRQIFGRRFTAPAPGACAAGAGSLCLAGGRFQVDVAWHDQHNGGSGLGTAVADSDRTGFFWFFNPANIELVVKVLDATSVNGHFWVFYGALSDVQYTITVTDVETGQRRFYDNAPGSICGRGDTGAFPLPATGGSAAGAAAPMRLVALPLAAPGSSGGTCAGDDQHLCLLGDRFRVSVAWHDQHNGGDGVGHALTYADKTGFFWFFNPSNIELVVKVLDGRSINGNFWVFYGALSDVEYTITVTDTAGPGGATYPNPPGNICGVGDTGAIPGSP